MLKETLERFDEQFVDKQRGTVDLLKDEMPNGDFLRADYIKQFITEEIKLAMEEIKPKYKDEKECPYNASGYNWCVEDFNSNISKYFE